jgi:malate/lactate dehydrogenase
VFVTAIIMMPNKNTKYAAPTKEGQERPLPVTSTRTATEEIPVAIVSMAPNGFVGTIENPNAMRVHVLAKSTAHDDKNSKSLFKVSMDRL